MPRRTTHRRLLLASLPLLLCLTAAITFAQSTTPEEDPQLNWIYGPSKCPLGAVATIDIPEGYQFVDGDGARTLMQMMQNPVSGDEKGFLMPEPRDDDADASGWFVIFEYNPIGYVRDTEKDNIDADALLESITKGTEEANKVRRKNGWDELHVVGWQIPPYYDETTHNLKWAIIGESAGHRGVNFSTRLLGRGGAMSVDLVLPPEELDRVLPEFDKLVARFDFNPDSRYAAFREGDKVAKYGLTALVAGGAGAVAMKTGLLAKFWKYIVLAFLAAASAVKRFFGRLFNRGGPQNQDRLPPA